MLAAARIDKGPDNIGAQVNSDIELKCLLHHRSCNEVIWTRTDFNQSTTVLYAGNNMLQSYGGRYSVSVSPWNGMCSLHIGRLQVSDAGTFTCADANEMCSVRMGGVQVLDSGTFTCDDTMDVDREWYEYDVAKSPHLRKTATIIVAGNRGIFVSFCKIMQV